MDWIQVALWSGLTAALMTLTGIVCYTLGERKGEDTTERFWHAIDVYKAIRRKN